MMDGWMDGYVTSSLDGCVVIKAIDWSFGCGGVNPYTGVFSTDTADT